MVGINGYRVLQAWVITFKGHYYSTNMVSIEVHLVGPFKWAYVLRLQDLGGPGSSDRSQYNFVLHYKV